MLDLQKHKEYLWKYLLTYGKGFKATTGGLQFDRRDI